MNRRILLGLLVCLAVIASCATAMADVLWEPNDDFYRNRYEDCEYVGRHFTANGKNGSVEIVKEPGSNRKIATAPNGTAFFVSFTYMDKNGAVWGVVQFTTDAGGAIVENYDYRGSGKTGWIRMNNLSLVYDAISFGEEHASEFKPYEGDYKPFQDIGEVVFWSYPGSGAIVGKMSNIDENFKIAQVYTDSDGKQWGHISYYYGRRNCWVCISDPTSQAIPASAVATPLPTPSQDPLPPQSDDPPALALIAVLVVVLVVATAALLRVFWKKK